MAMVLALSMPVVAQAQSCPPWDENCDSSEDDDYYGDDDDYYDDGDYYDTFSVGAGVDCVAFFDDEGDGYDEDGDGYDQDADGYEELICFDRYTGEIVYDD
jgi:hypothetical protein